MPLLLQPICCPMHRRLKILSFCTAKAPINPSTPNSTPEQPVQSSPSLSSPRPQPLSHAAKHYTNIDLTSLKVNYFDDQTQAMMKVRQLEHGLDRFLDGRLVFGDQGLGPLPEAASQKMSEPVKSISKYVQPSSDTTLLSRALQDNCQFISSTSSISSPLIALFYIFSSFRLPVMDNLMDQTKNKSTTWMSSFRKPTTFFLRKVDANVEAIVSDHGFMPEGNEVLMNLGHVIEYFLTHSKEETSALMRGEPVQEPQNYYRYAQVNQEIMLRSQIDCLGFDSNNKPYVFEIKSRACAPIRYDVENYLEYKDYQIDKQRGIFESFQREYYDLIRGGFLKYVMQVKIGRMDGAFIAYHNTEKIYGYEYVNIKQMALRVIGNQHNLDISFVCTCKMLTIVLKYIRHSLPEHRDDNLKIGFYADYKTKRLVVFVQALTITKQYPDLPKREPGLQSVSDYLTKYHPLRNPVYQFHIDFQILINGIQLNNPEVLFGEHDCIEMRYHATAPRRVYEKQYLSFLYNAYKENDYVCNKMYKGAWN